MDVRKLLLLGGALIVAIITALMAKTMFAGATAPQAAAAIVQEPVGPKVLVATRALPVGTILTQESFRLQPWPSELIENAYFTDKEGDIDLASLSGRVVRTAISAGQPITQGALVKPGDRGFLAAALGPGMRAITVPVSAESGVAGFVFPGDRVDIVLTQSVDGEGPSLKTSETIIRNLRVLAADQRTSSTNADGQTEVQVSSTVTLEVTPRLAEKIAVAQSIGELSLVLRAISDNPADLERAIAAGDVKLPANADPKTEKKLMLDMAARPSDTNPTFVTAGDVSRFQGRKPPRPAGSSTASTAGSAAAPASGAAPGVPSASSVRVWRSTIPEAANF